MTTDARSARRQRLIDAMRARGQHALVLSRASDVRWATGFTGSVGALLVMSGGGCVFATDARYAPTVAALVPEVELLTTRAPLAELVAYALERGESAVAVDADDLSWAQGRELEDRFSSQRILEADDVMATLRARKDPDEVAAVRHACRITEDAVRALIATIETGQTEVDIARRFLRLIDDLGADGPAFAPIVAAGPNAAIPHHEPGTRALASGDLLILDVGARVEGYCADLSRTFALGQVSLELKAVHDVVLRAQDAGCRAVRPGVSAGSVDAAAREVIEDAGHGEHFVHGTGHGVGLDIHEPPILRTGAAGILGESFIVTVEPGIYLPGIGGVRIEDTVIVGAQGAEPLTQLPRDLIVL